MWVSGTKVGKNTHTQTQGHMRLWYIEAMTVMTCLLVLPSLYSLTEPGLWFGLSCWCKRGSAFPALVNDRIKNLQEASLLFEWGISCCLGVSLHEQLIWLKGWIWAAIGRSPSMKCINTALAFQEGPAKVKQVAYFSWVQVPSRYPAPFVKSWQLTWPVQPCMSCDDADEVVLSSYELNFVRPRLPVISTCTTLLRQRPSKAIGYWAYSCLGMPPVKKQAPKQELNEGMCFVSNFERPRIYQTGLLRIDWKTHSWGIRYLR